MKNPRRVAACLTILLSLGCGPSAEDQEEAPPQTQRSRDSTIGASVLPGASGVRGALRVSDSATSRKRLIDSMAATP